MRYYQRLSPILFLLLLMFSCGVLRKNVSNENETQPGSEPSLVFLTLRISHDSVDGGNHIEVIDKKKVDGQIKTSDNKPVHYQNYLSVYLYSGDSLVRSMIIEHPLYKNIEYLDADNHLATKDVRLQQDDFFIRLQLTGRSDKIRIYETLKNTPKKELATIKL